MKTKTVEIDANVDQYFQLVPGVQFDFSEVSQLNPRPGNMVVPIEFNRGWRTETNSWKTTAYLGANLSGCPTYKITGPDAVKFLSETFVNEFSKFPVGTGRHGIICREDGIIMVDGVIIRTAEDEFITYWMAPYLQYVLEKDVAAAKYNVYGELISGTVFLYQLAGPRALEILEQAAQQDIHDLKFMHYCQVIIGEKECMVLRLGMAGTLAYEIHGAVEDAKNVYNALWEAGKGFGLVKLGARAYMMNHTENGFPQAYYHFPYPWAEDEGFARWMASKGAFIGHTNARPPVGSLGTDMNLRYRNPVDNGWGNVIKFNHEFVGRAALERIIAEDKTRMVTLKWNVDDILDIYRSQFEQGEHYAPMDPPNDRWYSGPERYHADRVENAAGALIGCSSGRCYSYWFREMLSLCKLDKQYAENGTEVIVIWGESGTRQKKIRATVERFPYLDQGRNEIIGTVHIPHFQPEK